MARSFSFSFSFASVIGMASVIVGALAVAGCAAEPAGGESTAAGKDALTCSGCGGGGGGGGDPASTGGTDTYCASSGSCSLGFYSFNASDAFEVQLRSKCAYPRYYNSSATVATVTKVARCLETAALDSLVTAYASSRHAQEVYACTSCLDAPAAGYVYVEWDGIAMTDPICPSGCTSTY